MNDKSGQVSTPAQWQILPSFVPAPAEIDYGPRRPLRIEKCHVHVALTTDDETVNGEDFDAGHYDIWVCRNPDCRGRGVGHSCCLPVVCLRSVPGGPDRFK